MTLVAITSTTKVITIQPPATNNTLDSQLSKATGLGWSCHWVFLDDNHVYCQDIDTLVSW